jgi:hypothetical protein
MTYSVSKNYVTALPTASVDIARSNRAIANDRLKADYKRLSAASISVGEKYFEWSHRTGDVPEPSGMSLSGPLRSLNPKSPKSDFLSASDYTAKSLKNDSAAMVC